MTMLRKHTIKPTFPEHEPMCKWFFGLEDMCDDWRVVVSSGRTHEVQCNSVALAIQEANWVLSEIQDASSSVVTDPKCHFQCYQRSKRLLRMLFPWRDIEPAPAYVRSSESLSWQQEESGVPLRFFLHECTVLLLKAYRNVTKDYVTDQVIHEWAKSFATFSLTVPPVEDAWSWFVGSGVM